MVRSTQFAMRSVHVREMTADKVGVTQLALSSGLTCVQVWVDGHVACYSNPNYPTANPADRRSGIFSIKEAGAVGVTSMNTCSGSVQVERRPGEIVVFTRPQTFWERFRS